MELKVLFIEDNEKLSFNLQKFYDGEVISGHTLKAENVYSFEAGISQIEKSDYDIVILDLYKDKETKDEEAGIKILNRIRLINFMPVIFYTGHTYKINDLISEIVGVVNKGDGFDNLTMEITRIIESKIALLKNQIYSHLKDSLRIYFWETVDVEKKIFIPGKNDVSLGYLLLRRFANSLSKENIKKLLGDDKIKTDKAHPMEFYLYPVKSNPDLEEYQTGEILKKDNDYFVILTPSCDLIRRVSGSRKADRILLARTKKFSELSDFIKFSELKAKENKSDEENNQLKNLEGKLKSWMANRSGDQDRYYFLPKTPFIDNQVVDFQNKIMVDYNELSTFQRIAKLDDPFAQSMIVVFIRYYNRIGFPDIDSDYIFNTF